MGSYTRLFPPVPVRPAPKEFDFLGTRGSRPLEVATLRLQNMRQIVTKWNKLAPPDKELITQQGGTVVFEGRDKIYGYKDKASLLVAFHCSRLDVPHAQKFNCIDRTFTDSLNHQKFLQTSIVAWCGADTESTLNARYGLTCNAPWYRMHAWRVLPSQDHHCHICLRPVFLRL